MTFQDKTQMILDKLKETNYEIFKGDKDATYKFMERTLSAFPEYANTIIREQIMTPIWRNTCDTNEYQENVQAIDTRRKNAHDCAITSFNMLNRICKKYDLPAYTTVDTSDRHAVADEVGKFIAEYYATGTNTTMYDITKDRTTDYDRKQLRIQEIERRLPTIENEEPNGEQLE